MTTNTQGAAIARYKIGYPSDEWGMRGSSPSTVPDAVGPLVTYADHISRTQETEATHLRELAAYRLTVENLEREIAAQQPAPSPAPPGWKLVPVEPTEEMLKAADDGDDAYTLRCFGPGVQRVMQGPYDHYCAMLDAAPTAQADTQPAQQGVSYAALPESFLEIPDVQDESGINAYYSREVVLECIDAALASHGQAPADAAPSAGAVAGPDDIDAIALTRYKVVHSHDSMFHRFAVVAGDGEQQLYLGREVECENMARKFAGAFLDGAFYQANITPPTQAQADSVLEDAARLDWLLLRISGAEFRRLGVHYSGNARRADVDAARKQGGAT